MARTIEQGFEKFISWLIPLSTEHEKAAKHKDTVSSCLNKNLIAQDFLKLVHLAMVQA